MKRILCENLLKNSSHHLAIAGAWGLAAARSQKRFLSGLYQRGVSLSINMFFLCKASLKMQDEYSLMGECIASQAGQVYKLLWPQAFAHPAWWALSPTGVPCALLQGRSRKFGRHKATGSSSQRLLAKH